MIRLRLVVLLALAAFTAACGSSGPTSAATASPPASVAPGSSASTSPEPSPGPSDSQATETEPPAETETPTESADTSAEPSASTPSTAADACTGTQGNKAFFVKVAGAVDWPVLCAVLPKGWFVSTGSYRLANGGKLTMSYKGPAGATLALSEGAFCQDGGGCVPSGTDAGNAALGSTTGTLVQLDDGGFAIVVDRGAARSWLLVARGVDQAAAEALGAALHTVEG